MLNNQIVRVSRKHVDQFRAMWLSKGWGCAICSAPFTKDDGPVVDHDHYTGVIRGVLHRACNSTEGTLTSVANGGHKGIKPYPYLIGLGFYLHKHSVPQTRMIHPLHLMPNERHKHVPKYLKTWRK